MTREELLAQFSKPIKVGQAGYVQLLDILGNDATVADSARVSYQSGTKTSRDDAKLIRYLIQNHHTSPLEQCCIRLRIKCPIYVKNQMVRHRMQSMNEWSLRYSLPPEDLEQIEWDQWRTQDSVNKQGSSALDLEEHVGLLLSLDYEYAIEKTKQCYLKAIEAGVAREQARTILPLAQYTEYITRIDLHNLLHMLSLRLDSHTQPETREFAQAIASIIEQWVPATWSAFDDCVRSSMSFNAQEQTLMCRLMKTLTFSQFLVLEPDKRKQIFTECGIESVSERVAFLLKLTRLVQDVGPNQ